MKGAERERLGHACIGASETDRNRGWGGGGGGGGGGGRGVVRHAESDMDLSKCSSRD